jgi:hypothetical protein
LKRPLPTTEASNDRPSKRVATGGSSKKRSPGKNPGEVVEDLESGGTIWRS